MRNPEDIGRIVSATLVCPVYKTMLEKIAYSLPDLGFNLHGPEAWSFSEMATHRFVVTHQNLRYCTSEVLFMDEAAENPGGLAMLICEWIKSYHQYDTRQPVPRFMQ